ncbi:MAG: alpha/beta fold hydrolase [Polyangiaceae bacterium]
MSAAPRLATLFRITATRQPRGRLFCIPFAGGGVGAFRGWNSGAPEGLEIFGVGLPGRESRLREPAFDSIPEIVEAVRSAITSASDLPFALFGHSMGALVAFELALALEAAEHGPEHLFVSARRPPDEPDPQPDVHTLPDEPFVDELQRRYGAIPDAVRNEPELLALLLPTLRADIRALERYTPISTRKVRCPVHVFGGLQDTHPAPAQLPGWQRVAEHGVRVRLFPGNHFYLATQQAALMADIRATWADDLLPPGPR